MSHPAHDSALAQLLRAGTVFAAAECGGLLSRIAGFYRDMTDAQGRVLCAGLSVLALAVPSLYRLALDALARQRLAAELADARAKLAASEAREADLRARLAMRP